MSLSDVTGPLAYLAVFAATVVEGEVVFVAATVLVQMGRLDALGVYVSAALGGSVGDQLYFYALRGRLRRLLDRFPAWAARRDLILARVRENATAMILACRFLPGLRVAIPAACACAQVAPARFTSLSLASSALWAAAVMGAIAWLGPASFAQLGVKAWWTPLVPAALVLLFTWWLGRTSDSLRGGPCRSNSDPPDETGAGRSGRPRPI
jgi:membrane protein DedA with SNARE-associated domain